jgi:hypothetical protein
MESTTSAISNMSIKSACQMFSPVIQPVGEALSLIKLFLPLVLIVICSFDLLKIVISSKKEKGKNSFKSIIFRILYSICILLIPVAAMMFFNFFQGYRYLKKNSGVDYNTCYNCLFDPHGSVCEQAVKVAKTLESANE